MAIDTLNKQFPYYSLIDSLISPDRVDTGLDQDPLLLVPGDDDGVEEELLGLPDLYLRLVMSLHLLAGEVLHTHRSLQRSLDAQQIRLQGGGLKQKTFLTK